MADSEEFTFKCIVCSVDDDPFSSLMNPSGVPRSKIITEEKDEIFIIFRSTIRQQLAIPGNITFYVGSHSILKEIVQGRQITNLTETLFSALGKTETLIIRYDETKNVAAGGVGKGALVSSSLSTGVLAEGGMGYGGVIDVRGGIRGGKGVGGSGKGEGITGQAGNGYGGLASSNSRDVKVKSGTGAGGELLQYRLHQG